MIGSSYGANRKKERKEEKEGGENKGRSKTNMVVIKLSKKLDKFPMKFSKW